MAGTLGLSVGLGRLLSTLLLLGVDFDQAWQLTTWLGDESHLSVGVVPEEALACSSMMCVRVAGEAATAMESTSQALSLLGGSAAFSQAFFFCLFCLTTKDPRVDASAALGCFSFVCLGLLLLWVPVAFMAT